MPCVVDSRHVNAGPHEPPEPTDLKTELAALDRARQAAKEKLVALADIKGGGVDEISDQFIDAVVRHTMDKMRQELVVFGRIDDSHAWRVGLFGIDSGGEQLVVDWRAPFAAGFYQATLDDPHGLDRRISYVGSITDLMIEDFVSGGISGSSPLMAELSRSRGTEMKAAVATLQSEQDRLVRLDPAAKLVLRGGPGTGKTVVALHRAAWLVYNDRRITNDRILVLGPSERFLRYVATVLPTLGESRITQTTLDRFLGPATEPGGDERWLDILDRFEASLPRPATIRVRGRAMPEAEVTELVDRLVTRKLAWRDRRHVLSATVAARLEVPLPEARKAAAEVIPSLGATGAWRKIRSRATLRALDVDETFIDAWLAVPDDGPLRDEVSARFDGSSDVFSHVIVDEAQDLTFFQLRAVLRRADGLTLVGDDAQRSVAGGQGLRSIADRLDVPLEQMATAYRMSAEIAEWLNDHAHRHGIDAVELIGIRPTGIAVTTAADAAVAAADLRARWSNVAIISSDDVWSHKGVEYDGVVVDQAGMDAAQIYLAASRAAHELVLI